MSEQQGNDEHRRDTEHFLPDETGEELLCRLTTRQRLGDRQFVPLPFEFVEAINDEVEAQPQDDPDAGPHRRVARRVRQAAPAEGSQVHGQQDNKREDQSERNPDSHNRLPPTPKAPAVAFASRLCRLGSKTRFGMVRSGVAEDASLRRPTSKPVYTP